MSFEYPEIPFSCDTLAVKKPSGGVIFAKNSDRPGVEPQPLTRVQASKHAPGDTVACQYLTIPQVGFTYEVLGSRPAWLWGFEHGVNEMGVAIGNEAVYTLQPVAEGGLLGMDLVRLALERADTAANAVGVITKLLASYGQGGNAVQGSDRRYHNSFLVADPTSIFVIETSDRNWVVREAPHGAAISNHLTIEDDWTASSPGLEEAAGLLAGGHRADTRVNFRASFEDSSARIWSQARYLASCMLVQRSGPIRVSHITRHLRDHFEGGTVHVLDSSPEFPRPKSICMHPGVNLSGTAASMVVDLGATPVNPIAWCSMATPCTSPFLPIRVGANLPPVLTDDSAESGSLWWRLRAVQEFAQQNPAVLTPPIQARWIELERQTMAELTDADAWSEDLLADLLDRVSHGIDEVLAQRDVPAHHRSTVPSRPAPAPLL